MADDSGKTGVMGQDTLAVWVEHFAKRPGFLTYVDNEEEGSFRVAAHVTIGKESAAG